MKKLLIHPEELDRNWIDRMADHGIHILGLHPEGGKQACASAHRLVEQCRDPQFRKLIDYAHGRGLQIEYALHAASYLLPRELFDTHPEFFRMEDGCRTPHANFCVSEPRALEIVADRAAQLAASLYGSRPYYYFWMDDNRHKICTCPKCRALSASDQQLLAVNAIAQRLRQDDPQAKVSYLAYHSTITPPAGKPAPGVFLEYAPITRDMNAPASSIPGEDIQNILALLAHFEKEDATALEYWYDNSLFSGWKKPPKPFRPRNDLIPGDVRWYEDLGFRHIASFACFLGEDYVNLYGQPDISAFRATP